MPMIRDGLMEYYFIVVQEFSKMKRRIERIYKVIPNTASNMIVIVMLHSTPKQIRTSRDYVYSMANENKNPVMAHGSLTGSDRQLWVNSLSLRR